MKAQQKEVFDAFNNALLPQLCEKLHNNSIVDTNQLTKEEMKEIKSRITEFDNFFVCGWKESKTRAILKDILTEFADTFRSYSLLID